MKKFYRSENNVIAGGICGGISEYFKVYDCLVRSVLAGLMIVFPLFFIPAYFLFWWLLPVNDKIETK